jgi:hypothetical protein
LRARIGALSVDLAGKLVTERLSTDEQRSAAVDRLLDQLDGMATTAPAPSKGDS